MNLNSKVFKFFAGIQFSVVTIVLGLSSSASAMDQSSMISVTVRAQAPGEKLNSTTSCVASLEDVKASYVRSNHQRGSVSFVVQPATSAEAKASSVHVDWKVTQFVASDETDQQSMGAIVFLQNNRPLEFTYGVAPNSVHLEITVKSGCGH
jgi:hypothetical protein